VKALRVAAILFFFMLLTSPHAFGKAWPSEPITIIVGFASGGSTDLATRMLAESIAKSLGVPVIVENKPGAGSEISLNLISKAKPDGYTIGTLSSSLVTERPHVKKTPYDPVHGFSYIAQMFNYGHGFVVRSDSPWKTFGDFVEAAKKQPGKLTVSMSSIGGTMHVALGKLEQKIPGFKTTPVPYKGGVQAVTALLGGHVDACFQTPEWKPYVDAGQLRLLACPTRERLKDYPNVPTWIDLGYDVYAYSPGVYIAPPELPDTIRERLQQEFKKAADYTGYKEILKKFSLVDAFKPGPETYKDLMKLYNENKEVIPRLGIVEQ